MSTPSTKDFFTSPDQIGAGECTLLTNHIPYARVIYRDEVCRDMLNTALRKLCYYTQFSFTWHIECAWGVQH